MMPELSTLTAAEVRRLLDLAPHPEGGSYRETFRDSADPRTGRAISTAIYFLLEEHEMSRWHRIDATEIWHYYAGYGLELAIAAAMSERPSVRRLGPRIDRGEAPQLIVPASFWQSAKSLGPWTLVGCTVAPGFAFDRFELAENIASGDGTRSRHVECRPGGTNA